MSDAGFSQLGESDIGKLKALLPKICAVLTK